jgi:Bacterial Ig domain
MRKFLFTLTLVLGALSFMVGCDGDSVSVNQPGEAGSLAAINVSLVDVSMPDSDNVVQVTGEPLAVRARAIVTCINDIQGHSVSTTAIEDGSFEMSIPGVSNDTLSLSYQVNGRDSTTINLIVPLDEVAPADPNAALIDAHSVDTEGNAAVTGLPGAVEANSTVVISNNEGGEIVSVVATDDGSFTAGLNAQPDDQLSITSYDRYGNASAPVVAVVSMVASAVPQGFTPKGIINGAVFDKWNKAPLVGAVVRLSLQSGVEMSATTGAGGTYAFYGIPATKGSSGTDNYSIDGGYTLTCDASAVTGNYKDFKIMDGDVLFADMNDGAETADPNNSTGINLIATAVNFAFGLLQGTINGTVLLDVDVSGMAGVAINIMRVDPGAGACGTSYCIQGLETTVTTGANGTFSATNLEEGFEYDVVPALPNFSFTAVSQTVYVLESGAVTYVNDFVATESSTADAVNPYLVDVDPCMDENLIAANLSQNVTLTFGEDVNTCCDDQKIARLFFLGYKGEGDIAEPAWLAQTVTIAANVITIDPAEDLLAGARYIVYIGVPGTNGPYVSFDIKDMAGLLFDGSHPNTSPIGTSGISYEFTTQGGGATVIAPTQLAMSADNGTYTPSAGVARFTADEEDLWDSADGTVDGAASLGADWLVMEWTKDIDARGYKVYLRPVDAAGVALEPWEDITVAAPLADVLTGYPGEVLGKYENRYAAQLSVINTALTGAWTLDNTNWDDAMRLEAIVAPIDSDGAIVPLLSTNAGTIVNDNTAPYVMLNASFYATADAAGDKDIYAIDSDDTAAFPDGNMLDSAVAVSVDNIDFLSLADPGKAVFATQCCEWGLSILMITLNEPITETAANLANIGIVDGWNLPLSCDYDSIVINDDSNLGWTGASYDSLVDPIVDSLYPTGSDLSADEEEPTIIERQMWVPGSGKVVALLLNEPFTFDSGDVISTIFTGVAGEGLTDLIGNVSNGSNPMASVLQDVDPDLRVAQIADNMPPLAKAIWYVEGTVGNGWQDKLYVEMSEKIDIARGMGFTDYTDTTYDQTDIDNAAATFIATADLDAASGVSTVAGYGAAVLPSAYVVEDAGTLLVFNIPDVSVLQDEATITLNNMCDVELLEETGYTEKNCNSGDTGLLSYNFVDQFVFLKRFGAYMGWDATLASLVWGTNILNTGLSGEVGMSAGFIDNIEPRLVGVINDATDAQLDFSEAANSVGYDNATTPQSINVYFTEPMYIDPTDATGGANSVQNPANWSLSTAQIVILNWNTAIPDCSGPADGWGGAAGSDVTLASVMASYNAATANTYGGGDINISNITDLGAAQNAFSMDIELDSGDGFCQFAVTGITAGTNLRDNSDLMNPMSTDNNYNTWSYNRTRERPVAVTNPGWER